MSEKQLLKLKKEEVEILDYVVEICNRNNLKYVLIGGTLLGAVRHNGFIPWDDDIDIAMPRKDYQKFIEIFESNDKYLLDCNYTNKNYWLPFLKVRKKNTEYIENLLDNYVGNKGIWVDIFPLDNSGLFDKFKFKFTTMARSALSKKNKVLYKKPNFFKNFIIILLSLFPRKVIYLLQYKIMTLSKNENSKYILNLGSQYGFHRQRHLRNEFLPTKLVTFENKKYCCPQNNDYVLKNIYGKNYMQLPPIEKRVTHNPLKIKFEDGEEIYFNEKI